MTKKEAATRGVQIRDVLGVKDETPITCEQLKFLKESDTMLTESNEDLKCFLDSITDFERASDWLNRNSYSLCAARNLLGIIKHPSGKRGL